MKKVGGGQEKVFPSVKIGLEGSKRQVIEQKRSDKDLWLDSKVMPITL